jgi:flagellar biogenesis protein FliO
VLFQLISWQYSTSIENKPIIPNDVVMIKYLLAAVEATTQAPAAETLPSYEGAFLKMILTFVALIVGIIGTVWFMKRLSGGRFGTSSSHTIKVLEKKALSPKTMLYVIEIDGKQTVIAESQLEIKRIMDLENIPIE